MIKYFRNKLNSFSIELKAINNIFEVSFFKFIFSDLAFTVLPLLIIVFISFAMNDNKIELLSSPELSFASIVLYGITVTHFIELKTKYQSDFSYKLEVGSRLFIILLIFSVLTLSLSVLVKYEVDINKQFVYTTQISLFIFSIFSVFVSHFAKERINYDKQLISKVSKDKYYKFILDSADRAKKETLYIEYALRKKNNKLLFSEDKDFDIIENNKIKELEDSIKNIELNIKKLQVNLKTLKN
ncbi:hypothetical protein [Sulfurimonas sp.]|uniref:hypothetical protein n=1 Tax=Sulfurimonas sp. TaxID=2022749 RepID=UPI003568562E